VYRKREGSIWDSEALSEDASDVAEQLIEAGPGLIQKMPGPVRSFADAGDLAKLVEEGPGLTRKQLARDSRLVGLVGDSEGTGLIRPIPKRRLPCRDRQPPES
jgi:hypothetical protein